MNWLSVYWLSLSRDMRKPCTTGTRLTITIISAAGASSRYGNASNLRRRFARAPPVVLAVRPSVFMRPASAWRLRSERLRAAGRRSIRFLQHIVGLDDGVG